MSINRIVESVGTLRRHKSRKENAQYDGTYLSVSRLWPNVGVKLFKDQFVGCHKCLCITISRPPELADVISIGSDLKENGNGVPITWMGCVRCTSSPTGVKIYIPRRIWVPPAIIANRFPWHKIPCYVEEVKAGESQQNYWLLTVPMLTRDILVRQVIREAKENRDGKAGTAGQI